MSGMKFVSVIQDTTYFHWQQEIQAFNFQKLGILNSLVVVVLYEPGAAPSDRMVQLGMLAEVHFFDNAQLDRSYSPSNKPYGLMRLLQKAPWYGSRLLTIDSDVVLRLPLDSKLLDGPNMDDPCWYVSNSGVIGFIGHDYLAQHLDGPSVDEMARLVGLSGARLQEEQQNSGGAQIYMKNVTSAFFRQVTDDCLKIRRWVLEQKRDDGTFKLQVWTAEMWAMLWNAFRMADVRVSRELDFAWAPHERSMWDNCKILHLAGVNDDVVKQFGRSAFQKGDYTGLSPWEAEQDFSHIDRGRCWGPYVELIEDYRGLPKVVTPLAPYRALVAYVDDRLDLIRQASALYQSLIYSGSTDTDLVLFGPSAALDRIPDGLYLVKCVQDPHPLASQYGFINSLHCFTAPGHEILNKYRRLLKTDVDTFVTPAWNSYYPARLSCGQGGYSNSQDVRDRCKLLAESKGLVHKGLHNLGSTIWGETSLVKDLCRLATELTEHLIQTEFATEKGEWPNWYWGVSSMYATEVAMNHLVQEIDGPSDHLDFSSTSDDDTASHPHIHCWHVDRMFSKHAFQNGAYQDTEDGLDLSVTHDYCLAMSLRGRNALCG
jgi:hypothetical protein